MGLLIYKTCECCGEKFPISSVSDWEWKIPNGKTNEYYCTYKCYSKVFDKRYTASRVNVRVSRPSSMPVELERALRSGRR